MVSPNIGLKDAQFSGVIGDKAQGSVTTWGLPDSNARDTRIVTLEDQRMMAIQALYTPPDVTSVEAELAKDPSAGPYDFPVQIS